MGKTMDSTVANYLAQYYRDPAARLSVREAYHAFLESLPNDRARRVWPRWRFVEEVINAGFQVGVDGSNVAMIAGLSTTPPTKWTVSNGRLTLACV